MKAFIGALMLCSTLAFAQSPVPDPDTLRDVKQTDPELKVAPKGAEYRQDHQHISTKQLPEPLRQTLKGEAEYSGWEHSQVYKSKTGSEYVVEITRNDTTRTFKFDRTGRRLKE